MTLQSYVLGTGTVSGRPYERRLRRSMTKPRKRFFRGSKLKTLIPYGHFVLLCSGYGQSDLLHQSAGPLDNL